MLAERTGRLALLVATMAAITWGVSAPAEAQLAAGRRALDAADFQRAIRAFDRAERSERLDRDELVSLYEGRIIARFAVGTRSRAQRDLQILGSLDPQHAFPVEVPPEVGEALATTVRESGGGLGVTLAWSDDAAGSTLTVEVVRDPAEIVTGVRVHTRAGDAAWSEATTREVRVSHGADQLVGAWVEVLGPRGVVLLREGSEASPSVHGELPQVITPPVVDMIVPPPPQEEIAPVASNDDGLALGLGLGLGGAALVAAGVVLGLVFGTQTSSDTQPTLPMVVGF